MRRALLFVVLGLTMTHGAAQAETPEPIDPDATPETRALFGNLDHVRHDKILFGHQNSTLYGVGWKNEPDRSDVKSVTGSYPAVYGWDLANLFQPLDGVSPEELKAHVEAAYARGGVNTFSWHMFNPVTGKNFYDKTPAVAAVLPGGAKHDFYRGRLDEVAAFFRSLKGSRGEAIPIIFRPFHEHTGDWFWWGQAHCTTAEFVALWRFTLDYLRKEGDVHNLLYAYSPGNPYRKGDEYFERYPGDDYVDVLGYDAYTTSSKPLLECLSTLVEEAERRGKIPALTEAGYPEGLSRTKRTDYYTRGLLGPIKEHPVARRIAYVLVWRNAHEDHFWAPYPGQATEEDFKAFHADPVTVFEDTLPDMYANPSASDTTATEHNNE